MNKVIWSWEDNWSGDQWDRSATKKDYRDTESDHKAKSNAIKKEAKKTITNAKQFTQIHKLPYKETQNSPKHMQIQKYCKEF